MKTSKTSRKIFKSRTLIILPHFPLENPNLEKNTLHLQYHSSLQNDSYCSYCFSMTYH